MKLNTEQIEALMQLTEERLLNPINFSESIQERFNREDRELKEYQQRVVNLNK